MNANQLLKKVTKLHDVLKGEEANRIEAIDILDANVNSLRKEYNSVLIEYIKESNLLKHVTWKLVYDNIGDAIYLHEDGWTLDIKEELKDFAVDEYTHTISLLTDVNEPDRNIISLYLPSNTDEYAEPPYILIKDVEHLGPFLTQFELEVDITDLTKIIDAKQTEVAFLEAIKKGVPN